MASLNIYSKEQIDNKVESINNTINGINEDIESSKQDKITITLTDNAYYVITY